MRSCEASEPSTRARPRLPIPSSRSNMRRARRRRLFCVLCVKGWPHAEWSQRSLAPKMPLPMSFWPSTEGILGYRSPVKFRLLRLKDRPKGTNSLSSSSSSSSSSSPPSSPSATCRLKPCDLVRGPPVPAEGVKMPLRPAWLRSCMICRCVTARRNPTISKVYPHQLKHTQTKTYL